MEDKIEGIWNETGGEEVEYFKPELDISYHIRCEWADLRVSEKYKDDNDNPKKEVYIKLNTLNGQKTDRIFRTTSGTIIRELKKFVEDPNKAKIDTQKFKNSEFHMKFYAEGGNHKYLFSVSRELSPEASA